MDLKAALRKRPGVFGFFQAVRMLSLWDGTGPLPRNLRFRTPASLAFPRTEVLQVREAPAPGSEEHPGLEMEVGFMGLTGPSGVLPSLYTELVESRRYHHQDGALHAFLDLFSHRAVSLFYLAWLKYRFYRGAELGLQDGFSRDLMALMGLGLEAKTTQQGLGGLNGTCLHFGGILGRRPIPSGSLRAVVEGHLGVPVALEQFVFHWVQVAEADQSRLGACARDGLGSGTFLGVRQRDAQTSIRLLLGPLDARQFRDFLPDGKGGSDLGALMFDLLGPTMRVEVRLILRWSEVPPPRMGQPGGLSLGRNLWMFSTPPGSDQSDAVYELNIDSAGPSRGPEKQGILPS